MPQPIGWRKGNSGIMTRDFSASPILWICGGDFNDFLWDWEKAGGAVVNPHLHRYLGEFMNHMELLDMECNGPKFTWRGTRHGLLVEARLDRALVNKLWFECWLNTDAINGHAVGSDHNLVIVQGDLFCGKRKQLFRFEVFWAQDSECQDIVSSCWGRSCECTSMDRWLSKMNACRGKLIAWSWSKFKLR